MAMTVTTDPLVVLSHTFTGSKEFEYMRGEHLASYGFVVLAPDHKADYWASVFAAFLTRQYEVKRVITYAEALSAPDGDLAGLIDLDHVAVGGWSAGGITSYGIAGGRLDWSSVEQFCLDFPEWDACADLPAQKQAALDVAGLETEPEGLWPAISDARVDAIFPLAGVPYSGEYGLADITVPVMLLFGSSEPEVDVAMYTAAYDRVSSTRRAEIAFANAAHFVFDTDCTAVPWLADMMGAFAWCSDPVWDMSRAHDLIHHFTTAFLLDVLEGDEEAHAALMPDAVNFPGIIYKTTMQ